MRIFIGGVMQASNHGKGIVDQTYRNVLAEALTARWPEVEVIDPFQLHPDSVEYGDPLAKETLLDLLTLAGGSDMVLAYLPVASMGTALEMYSAYQRGVPVVAISPLAENWVVRAFARRVYPDVAGFMAALEAAASPADLTRKPPSALESALAGLSPVRTGPPEGSTPVTRPFPSPVCVARDMGRCPARAGAGIRWSLSLR